MQFGIGVLINGEPMPVSRLAGFILVWIALAVFVFDVVRGAQTNARTARARAAEPAFTTV